MEGAQRSKGSERAVDFADRMAALIADWRADGVGAAFTLSPAAFDVGEPDVSDAPDSDEPKPKRTRTDNHHPVPANKTLPPGWCVEWRDAPVRSYRVLLGPAGELCFSYAKAWQVATAHAERLD